LEAKAKPITIISMSDNLIEPIVAVRDVLIRVAVYSTQLGETAFAAIWADAFTRQVQEVVEEILKNKCFPWILESGL
jgi:hypothetical protein